MKHRPHPIRWAKDHVDGLLASATVLLSLVGVAEIGIPVVRAISGAPKALSSAVGNAFERATDQTLLLGRTPEAEYSIKIGPQGQLNAEVQRADGRTGVAYLDVDGKNFPSGTRYDTIAKTFKVLGVSPADVPILGLGQPVSPLPDSALYVTVGWTPFDGSASTSAPGRALLGEKGHLVVGITEYSRSGLVAIGLDTGGRVVNAPSGSGIG